MGSARSLIILVGGTAFKPQVSAAEIVYSRFFMDEKAQNFFTALFVLFGVRAMWTKVD